MKIELGTRVYHKSKGKGFVLMIKERKESTLITCSFPTGQEFITRKELIAGTGDITLKPQSRLQGNAEDEMLRAMIDGVIRGL